MKILNFHKYKFRIKFNEINIGKLNKKISWEPAVKG